MYDKLIVIGVFILADIVTGIIKALKNGNFSSSIMREGLFHKLAEVAALGLGFFADFGLPVVNIEMPFSFAPVVTGYIVVMEIGSICENIGECSPEIGKMLSGLFDKLKTEEHDETE